MSAPGLGYVAAFLAALALSLLCTPVALRVAVRAGILDRPGSHKGHELPVPYLGGIAIMAAFCAAVGVAVLAAPLGAEGAGWLPAILPLGLAVGAVGLVDDLRGLGPVVRLAAQAAAALVLWTLGVSASVTTVVGIDLALTVLWIVGVTNAYNLLDNMDGLSAGIGAIAALWFFLLSALAGQDAAAVAALALAGSALGFLRCNRHPARIYMGDAGSLFIGFVLAVLGLELDGTASGLASFAVPVLVLGVAIFDTSLVTVTRLVSGRSPFRGGRDHTSHRLVSLGLGVPRAVGLLYAVGAALGAVGVATARVGDPAGVALAAVIASATVPLGARLAAVPVDTAGGTPQVAPTPAELAGRSGT
jgi:UDP-GlcNAc:undecaprenyl-phosphate GlcNAc-1-phosphate transferase